MSKMDRHALRREREREREREGEGGRGRGREKLQADISSEIRKAPL